MNKLDNLANNHKQNETMSCLHISSKQLFSKCNWEVLAMFTSQILPFKARDLQILILSLFSEICLGILLLDQQQRNKSFSLKISLQISTNNAAHILTIAVRQVKACLHFQSEIDAKYWFSAIWLSKKRLTLVII